MEPVFFPLSFSVIIPARNAEKTIAACLTAVSRSSVQPDEVILVDDASSDRTADIARQFRVKTDRIVSRTGPMEPRFVGAGQAAGDILFFIDADVQIRENTFEIALRHFQNPEVAAVTGVLSRYGNDINFPTAYKNEYMNHVFRQRGQDVDFVYGSLWAVRRAAMIRFIPITKPFGSLVADSEMGFHLRRAGGKIVLDHTLEVDHLKVYSLRSLIVNDFKIPFMFALMFCRYEKFRKIPRSFSHASIAQVLAAWSACAVLLFACAAVGFRSPESAAAAVACLGTYFFIWSGFFIRIKDRGMFFLVQSAGFGLIDAMVMIAGMISGFLYVIISGKLKYSNMRNPSFKWTFQNAG